MWHCERLSRRVLTEAAWMLATTYAVGATHVEHFENLGKMQKGGKEKRLKSELAVMEDV